MKKTDNSIPSDNDQAQGSSEPKNDIPVDVSTQDDPEVMAADSSDMPEEEVVPEVDPVEKQIQDLTAERDAAKDQSLRIAAEFENFKKRSSREYDEFKKFANESFVKNLLPAIDNLERAVESAGDDANTKVIVDGVKMTLTEVMKTFEKFNVLPISAAGTPFNPELHQAVMQEEADDVPANQVLKVLQNGYTMNERLLRPAMVVVSKASAAEASAEA